MRVYVTTYNESLLSKMAKMIDLNTSKIFRFKLSDDILLLITQFAKMHQYDDRHTYKDAWQIWAKEHEELVEREVSRLKLLGYKSDVMDKMFKAGRYYFREKKTNNEEEKEQDIKKKEDKKDQKKKRDYTVMDSEVIQAMDKHLIAIMKQPKFKPANGYAQFCEEQIDLLKREIIRLTQMNASGGILTKEKLAEKIKKTYKNRYYILSQQGAGVVSIV